MSGKILITPKSYFRIRDKMLPLLKDYEVIFNDLGRTFTETEMIDLAGDVEGIIFARAKEKGVLLKNTPNTVYGGMIGQETTGQLDLLKH